MYLPLCHSAERAHMAPSLGLPALDAEEGYQADGGNSVAETPCKVIVKAEQGSTEKEKGRGSASGKQSNTNPGTDLSKKTLNMTLSEDKIREVLKTHKKCSACQDWKENLEFFSGQGRCKECSNMQRNLMRMADNQGCRAEYDTIVQGDDKSYRSLLKKYKKTREMAAKSSSKVKFSVTNFIAEYRTKRGARSEALGEMVWEQEWLEMAATVKYGYMTREEAQAEWRAWLADDKVPKDNKGPRGFIRVWVKTKDQLSRFAETSRDQVLSKLESLGKNCKAETFDARVKMLGNDAVHTNLDSTTTEKLFGDNAFKMLAAEGDESFQQDGLTGRRLALNHNMQHATCLLQHVAWLSCKAVTVHFSSPGHSSDAQPFRL